MDIKALISENYLLRRMFISPDTSRALENLSKRTKVAYRDFKFATGQEYNGWVIPSSWEVEEGKIFKNGKVIYDALKHPLAVISYSSSFKGSLSRADLLKHLFFTPERPAAIPFHFRLQYRPWDKDWGFCVPKNFVDSLTDGKYEVVLKTKFSKGQMVAREFTIPGKTKETIIFAAHIDHPGMSNDDMSGCALGIGLINKIREQFPKNRFTYKLLICPEIVGSVFYLNAIGKPARSKIISGMFLEGLGNDNSLHLQESFTGDAYIDRVAKLALKKFPGSRVSRFRESIGNDEISFEAPGVEIPTVSISRWPYPEYHTSDDNMDIIQEDKLQEALAYILDLVFIIENDRILKRKFDGLVSFANPRYDLYIDPGQIISGGLNQNSKEALFQYKLPRLLDGTKKISDISEATGIDFKWLLEYFKKMEQKKLINTK